MQASVYIARKFVAQLYDAKNKHSCVYSSFNMLRAKMSEMSDLARLPPSEPAFLQHVKRAMWQTLIWVNSHDPTPDLGHPEQHGWKREKGQLTPIYYEGPMASELLNELVCQCSARENCKRVAKCTCKQNRLPCI